METEKTAAPPQLLRSSRRVSIFLFGLQAATFGAAESLWAPALKLTLTAPVNSIAPSTAPIEQ